MRSGLYEIVSPIKGGMEEVYRARIVLGCNVTSLCPAGRRTFWVTRWISPSAVLSIALGRQ